MNRTGKIILGLVIAAVGLCLCGIVGAIAFFMPLARHGGIHISTDGSHAERVAEKSMEFSVPDGYEEDFSFSALGYHMVAYSLPRHESSHLYVMSTTRDVDMRTLERRLRQTAAESIYGDRGGDQMQIVDQQTVTIRDQNVLLTISEGVNGSGRPIRQAVGLFEGDDGPVAFAWIDSNDEWDQHMLEDFLASIE